MSAPLEFVGTAHPPAKKKRDHPADLSEAEIAASNLGSRYGKGESTPILVEHEGEPVGKIISSYKAPSGSLRVLGTIHDERAKKLVRDGKMLGLSLGTDVVHRDGEEDNPVVRTVQELSICVEPRRRGCYISQVDGQTYRTATMAASKQNGNFHTATITHNQTLVLTLSHSAQISLAVGHAAINLIAFSIPQSLTLLHRHPHSLNTHTI